MVMDVSGSISNVFGIMKEWIFKICIYPFVLWFKLPEWIHWIGYVILLFLIIVIARSIWKNKKRIFLIP